MIRVPTLVLMSLMVSWAAVESRAAATEPISTTGQVQAVTVYRGQALVTRQVDVPGEAGIYEVIVRDLPAETIGSSVYAESADGVRIRSVRYRTRAESEDVREPVRELDRQIQAVRRSIRTQEQQLKLVRQHYGLIDKLEAFSTPSAQWEMARGVLDANVIQSIAQFLMAQRQTLAERELEITFRIEDLTEGLNRLERDHTALTRNSTRTSREAVVFVQLDQPDSSFRLRYLVNEATWTPSYNVRATSAGDSVAVEYLASIRQRSGEDWNAVAMTLSTATPALTSEAPRLSALTVSLTDRTTELARLGQFEYAERQSKLISEQRQVVHERNVRGTASSGPVRPGDASFNHANDYRLNFIGQEMQLLEVQVGQARASHTARPGGQANQESISVIYQLDGHTSLPSRADQQLIRIAKHVMDATFYRLAIPVLTEHVYHEAELVNEFNTVLLAGPVSSYLAGEFVGHGELPTVAAGERFTVGFGIDSTLRAHRDLIDRRESTQGGNRVVTMNYRLTLSNFSSEPRDVRLLDRLPVAAEGMDIRVELLETSHELAQTAAQIGRQTVSNARSRRDDGQLRWDLTVPAQAFGDDAMAVEYRFNLEYDRQRQLEGVTN